MLRVWVGFFLVLGIFGCEKQGAAPLVADEALWIRVIPKLEEAIKRPTYGEALDTLMEGIVDDPNLVTAGTAVFTELADDPKISAPLETLVTTITEQPALQAEVTRLMAEHPEATPDQVGDLVGQRFEDVWASPPVSAAWLAAFNLYVAKMRARPESQGVTALFASLRPPTIAPARLARWSKRLAVLEGKPLDERAARDAYLRHAWAAGRIDHLFAAVAQNPALHRITAQALVDLLALSSLRGDLQAAVVALLADATVRDNILAAMLVFAAKEPPVARVRTTLNELMTSPALIDVSGKLVGQLLANRDVRALAVRWYDQVRTEASIRAELDDFLDNW